VVTNVKFLQILGQRFYGPPCAMSKASQAGSLVPLAA
jgi:hypothetical protein